MLLKIKNKNIIGKDLMFEKTLSTILNCSFLELEFLFEKNNELLILERIKSGEIASVNSSIDMLVEEAIVSLGKRERLSLNHLLYLVYKRQGEIFFGNLELGNWLEENNIDYLYAINAVVGDISTDGINSGFGNILDELDLVEFSQKLTHYKDNKSFKNDLESLKEDIKSLIKNKLEN